MLYTSLDSIPQTLSIRLSIFSFGRPILLFFFFQYWADSTLSIIAKTSDTKCPPLYEWCHQCPPGDWMMPSIPTRGLNDAINTLPQLTKCQKIWLCPKFKTVAITTFSSFLGYGSDSIWLYFCYDSISFWLLYVLSIELASLLYTWYTHIILSSELLSQHSKLWVQNWESNFLWTWWYMYIEVHNL